MELFLLGPVQASVAGRPVILGARKQRLVLAVLALEVGKEVSIERLVELLWPSDPPATARAMIHTYISGLRAALAGSGETGTGIRLDSGISGYVLRCDPERIDVHQFRALLAEARRDRDDERRVAVLRRAVALWRGPALAGTADKEVLERVCRDLDEARLTAIEDLIAAQLRLGRHEGLVEDLLGLVREHLHRPRLTGALMMALHRAGRAAEAAATYQQFRRQLAEEFGLDPPAELRELHQTILRADPGPSTAVPVAERQPSQPPRQLPPDIADFTGRKESLAFLERVLRDGRAGSAMPIAAIAGQGGVGKTALAVHWAHQVADLFPDGQLYVNLRGFDPGGSPVEPTVVIRGFLEALQVPRYWIPVDPSAQAALFRSLLAKRRTLVVLDNARDAEQVRSLLPGSPESLVVITSRDQLLGLVATQGAVPLKLDLFTGAESREFLARRLGTERVATQPGATFTPETTPPCLRGWLVGARI